MGGRSLESRILGKKEPGRDEPGRKDLEEKEQPGRKDYGWEGGGSWEELRRDEPGREELRRGPRCLACEEKPGRRG